MPKQKKVLYAGTFRNGERVTRATTREYSHLWRTYSKATGVTVAVGFSGSKLLAQRQVDQWRARKDLDFEITTAGIVPEGFEGKLPRFRVKRFYTGQEDRVGYFETGVARKHLRFVTREEAEAWIAAALPTRQGVRFEVVEDPDDRKA